MEKRRWRSDLETGDERGIGLKEIMNGPVRLIMIRSGKYDYAEVEMDVPVHLVGPNNVGKTSLIAALQFLYLDEQRHMHFSRAMDETRRYYFPDPNSYILFELRTPAGFKVLGVRGLGPLKGFDFERFSYEGRFEKEDFIGEDGRILESDVVKARLSSKNYTILGPRHLRAALTGIGDSRGVYLHLVPIKDRDHFHRFRAIFKNLLRLSHLHQEELKSMVLDIFKGEFSTPVLDLETQYSEHFRRVKKEAQDLHELKSLEADIRTLLQKVEQRRGLWGTLPVVWQKITQRFERERLDFEAQTRRLESELESIERERQRVKEDLRTLRSESERISREVGALSDRIEGLKGQEAEFEGFVESWQKNFIWNLQKEVEALAMKISGAGSEPLEKIEQRIERRKKKVAALEKRLFHIKHLVATHVLKHLTREEVSRIFKVLNPEILALPMGGDVVVHDEAACMSMLAGLRDMTGGERFCTHGVEVGLESLAPPGLEHLTEPELVEADITSERNALKADLALMEAAKRLKELRQEKTVKTRELHDAIARLRRFQEYMKMASHLPEWHKELDELGKRQSALASRMEGLEDELQGLASRENELKAGLEDARRNFEKLTRRVQELDPPPRHWKARDAVECVDDLDELMYSYGKGVRDEKRLTAEIEKSLHFIGHRSYGRLPSTDADDTFERLREEVEAIEEKEKAVEELWSGIVVGLKSSFKGINRDLDTLKAKVTHINRALKGVGVSNLAQLKLVVAERLEITSRIRDIAESEEFSLFADPLKTREAVDAMGKLLSQMQRVELGDLFDLHFEILDSQGESRRYAHLENIESHGTTITIKVILNIILLRSLLSRDDVRIPFYLDEVSSLDHNNLQAIVDKSRALGFTPVLASPEAMAVADNIYFLTEQDGRVVLDSKTSLLRVSRKSGSHAQGTA